MENASLFGQGDADTSKHHGAAGVYFVGLSGVWDAFCRSCTRDLIIPNTIIFGQRGTLAGTYQVCIVVRYSRDRYCYCANPYQAKISALYSTDRQLHHHYEKLGCSGQGTSLPKKIAFGVIQSVSPVCVRHRRACPNIRQARARARAWSPAVAARCSAVGSPGHGRQRYCRAALFASCAWRVTNAPTHGFTPPLAGLAPLGGRRASPRCVWCVRSAGRGGHGGGVRRAAETRSSQGWPSWGHQCKLAQFFLSENPH